MRVDGSQIQNAIYLSGESRWPVGATAWEELARDTLDPGPFGYIAGGAGNESTMRANLEAFERRRLRPRMLSRERARATSPSRCSGRASPVPFFLAPIGVLSIANPDGEVAAARAAASMRIPFVLSSAASHSIEEIAEAMGNAPRWFQLYWVNDREICASFVRRAEAAGYGAIVVTLDTLTLGWRPRDLRNAYLPFLSGQGCAQFFTDPVFRAKLDVPPEEDQLTAAAMMLSTFPNLALTWDDLRWLREQTTLPLLVKGVLTAEDARARGRRRGRRRHRLESRRPPGRRLGRLARRARRGARGRGRPAAHRRRHPHRRRRDQGDGARRQCRAPRPAVRVRARRRRRGGRARRASSCWPRRT